MAKKSSVEKNNRKMRQAIKQGPIRAELRKKSVNMKLSEEERWEAQDKLQRMPRNGSICRVVNRCQITGRPRGVIKKFGMSRISFRELALDGKLPGVTKASW